MSYLDEIEKRCAAATDGPWPIGHLEITGHPVVQAGTKNMSIVVLPEDVEFISSARTDLPWAVAMLRRAKTQITDLLNVIEACDVIADEQPAIECASDVWLADLDAGPGKAAG